MKKLLFATLILALLAGTVSAQSRVNRQRHGQLTRTEVRHLRHDGIRYKAASKRAHRDGIVTRSERRRLIAMKRDQRRDLYRFRHNNRRRLI